MDEISEVQHELDGARVAFHRAVARMETTIDELKASGVATLIERRIAELNVGPESEVASASHLIGFVIGNLHSRGASFEQTIAFIEEMRKHGPTSDYEIRILGDDACSFLEDMHADEIWRLGRLLRTGVHESFIALRQAHIATSTPRDLWHKAVDVAVVLAEVFYPLITLQQQASVPT